MKLIKEPLEVDFYVDPRPMTKEDLKSISDYIKADKLKRAKKTQHKKTITNSTLSKSETAKANIS
ncbi:MAG: hypothetical protein WKG06_33240 [Segetibacter sp.]